MPSDSSAARTLMFDLKQVPVLACPVCYGHLREDTGRVVCIACSRVYPIINGIPVLIPTRAELR